MDDIKDLIDLGEAEEVPTKQVSPEVTGNGEKPSPDMEIDDSQTETVDQKVLNALEYQKRSSGTDQQDVEEVMGSIINRLQAAIRPSSVDAKTGIQLEKIMETFFVTTVNYTRKFDEKDYQHEISFDRSITAFPAAEGPCSLYDALGRNFDQQILEESKLSRYTAIKTLPPILHVLIQRSQSLNSKNGNPVVIPETLYLDRYLDAPHDSPIFRRRVQAWTIAERIADIKAQLSKLEANPSYFSFLENYDASTANIPAPNEDGSEALPPVVNGEPDPSAAAIVEESWDFDGPIEDGFMLVNSEETPNETIPGPLPKLEGLRETYQAIKEMMETELRERQAALEELLNSQKQVSYRLHAVICHRGHLTSGHYWVWIHDFEEKVWRWYNDADVRENHDTAEVLRDLSSSGEPYFLCYVRDEDKKDYVSVLGRQIPEKDHRQEQEQAAAIQVEEPVDRDVRIIELDEEPAKNDVVNNVAGET
ncbi:Ubiquitin carboxyl-terminal hydrolase 2 [Escovopsis weberi]|uniref:ubiquitinyl hydrolase 1 n=1 Tax=Escovopsis weberi TaxID=150374 RepID=A0A0M9VSW3_ESCWE|nr:Ubiquitin carboxyl-terminal hydrolase 2 [Escovopsis weberi]